MSRSSKSRLSRALLSLPLVALSFHLEADDIFSVSGFGNVSLIHSGTQDIGFLYDLTKSGIYDKWDLKTGSAFGVQLNSKISDSFSVVLQGVFQDRLDNDLNKTLTLAFLRYNIASHTSIRVGRIATPIYMLSEYRDVNFAYLWTKPITGFYASIPVTYINGGDISYRFPLGEGIFETRLFSGYSELGIETIDTTHNVTLSHIYGVKFSYSVQDWLFSAVSSTTNVKEGEPAQSFFLFLNNTPGISFLWPEAKQIASDFKFVDTRISYFSLGALYETGDWNVQSEISYTDTEWVFFPDLAAAYLSIGRVINNTSVYGFVSKEKSIGAQYELSAPLSNSLMIPQIASAYNMINNTLNARIIDQETFGLGVRIDLGSNVALKGQIERTWLKANHIGAWGITEASLNTNAPEHIDTLSFSVSFIF